MSHITLMVDSKVLESFHKHNISLEEFFILKCLVMNGTDLILNYTRGKTNAQKIIMMQPLVRKQLVQLEQDFYVLEEHFDFSSYTVSTTGRVVYSEVNSKAVADSVFPAKERPGFTGAVYNPVNELANTPTKKGQEEIEEFDQFVTSYLDLFPKGKNGGNKTLRSNFDDTKTKLIKFFNKYRRFTKEDVLKSTEVFLRKFRGDFTYCPTAEYFVLKDYSSALATECDSRLRSKEENDGREEDSNPFTNIKYL